MARVFKRLERKSRGIQVSGTSRAFHIPILALCMANCGASWPSITMKKVASQSREWFKGDFFKIFFFELRPSYGTKAVGKFTTTFVHCEFQLTKGDNDSTTQNGTGF